jgi:hypothetical protein
MTPCDPSGLKSFRLAIAEVWLMGDRIAFGGLHKGRLLQRCFNFRKAPYFALHKGIAIGFLKAIGFRNKPKRTIFDVWCNGMNYEMIKATSPDCFSESDARMEGSEYRKW